MLNGCTAMCNMCYQSTNQVRSPMEASIWRKTIVQCWGWDGWVAGSWSGLFRHEKLNLLVAQMKTKPFCVALHVNIAVVFRVFLFLKQQKKLIRSCFHDIFDAVHVLTFYRLAIVGMRRETKSSCIEMLFNSTTSKIHFFLFLSRFFLLCCVV